MRASCAAFVRIIHAIGWAAIAMGVVSPGSAQVFTPYPVNAQAAFITSGPDGALWFPDNNQNVDRLTTGGAFSSFGVLTPLSQPYGIVTGPDGALWFTEISGNNIGKITTDGQVTEYPIPTAGAAPFTITNGPDGNLWFTELGTGNLGQVTPAGAITEFPTFQASAGVTAGPDGAMQAIRKGQVRWASKNNPFGQRQFIHAIFAVAA